MNIYQITFSPTGTSLEAGREIAKAFDGEEKLLDLCEETGETEIEKDSLCIVSVPCYGGRIPLTAEQRIRKLHGAGAPAVICVTFGNRAFEDALLELADLLEGQGFTVFAGCAAVTRHNIMPVFGVGRPDSSDLEEMGEFARGAAEKYRKREFTCPDFPGNRPYKERKAGAPPVMLNKETCAGCGECAAKCPVQAISPEGEIDRERCIGCMRCVKLCPNGSRFLPKEVLEGMISRLGPACETRKDNAFYL